MIYLYSSAWYWTTDLGDDATIIDAMDWMLTHQLSSKNLSVGEKLAMTEEFQKEVALENEKKKKEGNKLGADITNNKTVSLQLEAKRNRETNTDRQIAKKASVGVGTVARYNRVMNSDDEAKQRKVAVEYVKLCGYRNGEIGKNHFQDSQNEKAEKFTLDEIAKELNMSRANLARALSIERNLIHRLYEVSQNIFKSY